MGNLFSTSEIYGTMIKKCSTTHTHVGFNLRYIYISFTRVGEIVT